MSDEEKKQKFGVYEPKPEILRENDRRYEKKTCKIEIVLTEYENELLELLRFSSKSSPSELFVEWIMFQLAKNTHQLKRTLKEAIKAEKIKIVPPKEVRRRKQMFKGEDPYWDGEKGKWDLRIRKAKFREWDRLKKRRRLKRLKAQRKEELKRRKAEVLKNRERKLEEVEKTKQENPEAEPSKCHPSFGRWQTGTLGPASKVQKKGKKYEK